MRLGLRLSVAVLLAVASTTVLVVHEAGVARACSCASIDPIDAIATSELVFTGEVIANEADEFQPRWRFRVLGIVKDIGDELTGGELDDGEIVLPGDDWGVGCGTDYGAPGSQATVYAHRRDGELRARLCMPWVGASALEGLLAQTSAPTGTGPPAALLVGTVGLSDVTVLDAQGRALGRAGLGLHHGIATHCPGTTLAAIATWDDRDSAVRLVDLADLTVVETRPIDLFGASRRSARMACLDGGDRVVVSAPHASDEPAVLVAVSQGAGGDVSEPVVGASRVVPHPAGPLLVLPGEPGDPVTARSPVDLGTLAGEAALPDGTSTIDGDVSPDGTRLAMLATLTGRAAEHHTHATHVVTIDLADGVPVAGTAAAVDLRSPDGDDLRRGRADQIRWVDDTTWAIVREGGDARRVELIDISGDLVASVDVGWGANQLAPVANGVLVDDRGGVTSIDGAGAQHPGDPAPVVDRYVDRILSIAPIVDAPPFEVDATEPVVTIRPVATADRPGAPTIPTPVVSAVPAVAVVGDAVADAAHLVLRRLVGVLPGG